MVRVRVREKMMVDVEIVVRTVLLVTVVSVVTAVCRTMDSESKKSVRLLLMLVMLLSTTTLVTLTMLTTSWVLVSVVSEVSVDVVVDVGAVDTIVRVTWTVLKDTVTAVCTQMSGLEFAARALSAGHTACWRMPFSLQPLAGSMGGAAAGAAAVREDDASGDGRYPGNITRPLLFDWEDCGIG